MRAVPVLRILKLCESVILQLQSIALRVLLFAVSSNFCPFNDVSSSKRLVGKKTPFVERGDIVSTFGIVYCKTEK